MARPAPLGIAASTSPSQVAGPAVVRAPHAAADDRRVVLLVQVLILVGLLAFWEFAIAMQFVEPLIFSSPIRIAGRIVSMLTGEIVYGRTIFDHISVTFQQIAIGYVLGAAVAVILGYVFGRVRTLRKMFEPIILALFSIPKIALAPLFVLILGIGLWSKVGIVFIEVFFVVFFNTMRGVLDVADEYVHIARIMGASRFQVFRRVIIPAALPSILLGLKMGVPFSIIGAVLGEYIASNRGLGWYILYSTNSFDASGLWAGIIFLVTITWLLGQIVNIIQARVLRWQPPRRGRSVTVA